jgi:hypothetical protein
VLFDVLKCHGGSFAESFWLRIFERVLLPIFDHVRAEVTDTTTFTSERRRQQEDAWLYETCTHCLQVRAGFGVSKFVLAASLRSVDVSAGLKLTRPCRQTGNACLCNSVVSTSCVERCCEASITASGMMQSLRLLASLC